MKKENRKLLFAFFGALLWVLVSFLIARPWICDVAEKFTLVGSCIIIIGIAFIPGFITSFLVFSLIISNHEKFVNINLNDEDITVLIACLNEEKSIYDTLLSVKHQNYLGNINVYVIDNGSTDNTINEVEKAKNDFENQYLSIKILKNFQKGKSNALNTGLLNVPTRYVITLDADTKLDKDAFENIYVSIKNSEYAAIAGWVLAENSKHNLLTKMQAFDYSLSIGAVKKMQAQFSSTLVAQGAFSIYNTEKIKEIGGFKDAIGEDIILTWDLLYNQNKVGFCENAVAYTTVPEKFKVLFRQRARWARGMIEALKLHKPHEFKFKGSKVLTCINLLMPYVDFSYIFFLIPGIIFAFLGYTLLAGYLTLMLIPLALLQIVIINYSLPKIKRKYFSFGFLAFMFFYQFLMSIMSLCGYFQEFTNSKRCWK